MEKLSMLVKFHGARATLPLESIVDTGASVTAISRAVADAIGAEYTKDKLSIKIANGRTLKCPLANVRLSIPYLRCSTRLQVAVVNAMIPPLIGSDFLQRKKMTVSYRDHSIRYRGKKYRIAYLF